MCVTPAAKSDVHLSIAMSGEAGHKVAANRDETSARFLIPALVLLTNAAFANSLSADCVYDDRYQIGAPCCCSSSWRMKYAIQIER
jgi:hypothetical protein